MKRYIAILLVATGLLGISGAFSAMDARLGAFEGGEEGGPSEPAKKPETGPAPERQPGRTTEPTQPPVIEPKRGSEEGGTSASSRGRGGTTVPVLGPEHGGVSVPERGSTEETLAAIEKTLDDLNAMTLADVTDVTQKISTLTATSPAAASQAVADSLEKSAVELQTAKGGTAARIRQFVITLVLFLPSVVADATQDVLGRITAAVRNAIESIRMFNSGLGEILSNTVQEIFNPDLPAAYDRFNKGPRDSEEEIHGAYVDEVLRFKDDLRDAQKRGSVASAEIAQGQINRVKISYNIIAKSRGWPQALIEE